MAKKFLTLPGWKVRGISRNPSTSTAQALIDKGVEIFQGDLDDKNSLYPAFEGANVIFSNTDFFAPFFEAIMSKDPASVTGGRDPRQYAYDRELEQGLNIARVAASPKVIKTLDLFVLSTLSDPRKWSHGKYSTIYHHNVKTDMIETIEKELPELAKRMSLVQLGHYVTNWKQAPPMAPQKQPDGSFVIKRTFSTEFQVPFVVPQEDTGAFVKALVFDLPTGTHLLGKSETMTWPEWMEIWARTFGVKARFEQVSHDEFFMGMPDKMKEELAETFAYAEEFGYTGGDPDCKTAEEVSHMN